MSKEDESRAVGKRERSPGRRALPGRENRPRQFRRLADTAADLTNRVLDWTEEMTDRFDGMASDPENDSFAARVIRSSEDIVDSLEEQQRETDDEADVEERLRAAREQHKRELQPQEQPTFVFYTADDPDTPINLRDYAKGRGKPAEKPERSAAEAQQAPAGLERTEPEELTALLGGAPVPPEGEPRPERRSPKPRGARIAERPARRQSAGAAFSGEERRQGLRMARRLQYWAFLLVLGFFGILGLLGPLRADSTSLESRPLAEKPGISVSGLWNGDYFGRLEQWYSDTYPLRDRLAGEYALLNPLGFGPVKVEAAAVAGEEETGTPAETQGPIPEAPEASAPAESGATVSD